MYTLFVKMILKKFFWSQRTYASYYSMLYYISALTYVDLIQSVRTAYKSSSTMPPRVQERDRKNDRRFGLESHCSIRPFPFFRCNHIGFNEALRKTLSAIRNPDREFFKINWEKPNTALAIQFDLFIVLTLGLTALLMTSSYFVSNPTMS